jgi:KDEL-tailed cysteine endopeptidase
MKTTCLFLAASGAVALNLDDPTLAVADKWAAWKQQFSFSGEEAIAMAKFVATEARIVAHNAKGLSYKFGHNQFSAMTPQEFKDNVVGHTDMKRTGPFDFATFSNSTVNAASLDWVAKGAVTAVKDQAQCGSCWAFSSTGSLEGAFQIATGKLTSFSEEQLVQCATKSGNQGCNGGLMDNSFKWWQQYPPVLEADYPYTSGSGTTGKCTKTKHTAAAKVGGFKDVSSETAMEAALNVGPVSVAIEADKSIFQSYTSGVITGKTCGTQLDHGVLAVGYGTQGSQAYWKVKNSWGATWGVKGYVLLAKGTDECGIADGPPSYPTGVTAPASYGSAGAGCCGTPCSSNGDCAINLFCCPNHNECMGDDTKSTAGPDCDACGHPSSVVAAFKRCDN